MRRILLLMGLVAVFYTAAWSQSMTEYGVLGANSAVGTSKAASSAVVPLETLSKRLAESMVSTSSADSATGQPKQFSSPDELMRFNRQTLEQGSREHGAMLHVESAPQGATLLVDHRVIARTPADLRLPAGKHVLELKSPAFLDWKQEVSVSGEEKLSFEPKLQEDKRAQSDKRVINLSF